MKRIVQPSMLHITTGLENGGAENILFNTILNSSHANHTVIFLTGLGHYGERLIDLGVNVLPLDFKSYQAVLRSLFKIYNINYFIL